MDNSPLEWDKIPEDECYHVPLNYPWTIISQSILDFSEWWITNKSWVSYTGTGVEEPPNSGARAPSQCFGGNFQISWSKPERPTKRDFVFTVELTGTPQIGVGKESETNNWSESKMNGLRKRKSLLPKVMIKNEGEVIDRDTGTITEYSKRKLPKQQEPPWFSAKSKRRPFS